MNLYYFGSFTSTETKCDDLRQWDKAGSRLAQHIIVDTADGEY